MIVFLQSPTKDLARLPAFAASVWEIYQFVPSPRFHVVYRDEFVIARFQHCRGEVRVPYSSNVITDCFQISWSMHFLAILSRCAKDFCRAVFVL